MLKEGDKVNHSVFGKGEVIIVEDNYVEIHFDKDEKYQLRTFTQDSIKPFLI